MTVQRKTNPLPVGRYWIVVNGAENIADFDAWLLDMHNAVKLESSELDPAGVSQFYIFRAITNAAFLNSEQFGFPNKAPASIKSQQDVEQVPDVEEPDAAKMLITAGKVAAGLFVAKLIVDLVKR